MWLVISGIGCGGPAPESADERGSETVVDVRGHAGERVDVRCVLPSDPDTLLRDESSLLLVWEVPAAEVFGESVLPLDSAYLAYRSAVRDDGAALRRPVADPPNPQTEAEALIWEGEDFNHEAAQSGAVGSIDEMTCLEIRQVVEERGLTQAEAGEIMGIDQPKVSALVNGKLDGFSMARLYRYLNALGRDVEIDVKPKPKSRKAARTTVTRRAGRSPVRPKATA